MTRPAVSHAAALAPSRPAPYHEAQLPRVKTAWPSPQLADGGDKDTGRTLDLRAWVSSEQSARVKTLLSILLLIAAATQSLFAQTIQTITIPKLGDYAGRHQTDIPVLAGEVFELLMWSNVSSLLQVDNTNLPVIVAGTNVTFNAVVAGPKTLAISTPNNESLVVTYKLTTISTVATQNVCVSSGRYS